MAEHDADGAWSELLDRQRAERAGTLEYYLRRERGNIAAAARQLGMDRGHLCQTIRRYGVPLDRIRRQAKGDTT